MADEMTTTEDLSSASSVVSKPEDHEKHEFVPEDVPAELAADHDQGNQSWWSDPDAKSSDPVDALGPQEEDDAEGSDTPTAFDPGEHTVSQVEAHVRANPDELDAVLAAEKLGQNRVTLVASLEAMKVNDGS